MPCNDQTGSDPMSSLFCWKTKEPIFSGFSREELAGIVTEAEKASQFPGVCVCVCVCVLLMHTDYF